MVNDKIVMVRLHAAQNQRDFCTFSCGTTENISVFETVTFSNQGIPPSQ